MRTRTPEIWKCVVPWDYFYRNYPPLHQTWSDLVLCGIISTWLSSTLIILACHFEPFAFWTLAYRTYLHENIVNHIFFSTISVWYWYHGDRNVSNSWMDVCCISCHSSFCIPSCGSVYSLHSYEVSPYTWTATKKVRDRLRAVPNVHKPAF